MCGVRREGTGQQHYLKGRGAHKRLRSIGPKKDEKNCQGRCLEVQGRGGVRWKVSDTGEEVKWDRNWHPY